MPLIQKIFIKFVHINFSLQVPLWKYFNFLFYRIFKILFMKNHINITIFD